MPTIALDFVSKRISVLPTARPLYGTESFSRNRSGGSSTASAVSRIVFSGDAAAEGVAVAQGVGRSFALFGAGSAAGQAVVSGAGASFSRLGAGTSSGVATAEAVAATTVGVVGSCTAQTIACAAYAPLSESSAGYADGSATAAAVAAVFTSSATGVGSSAGGSTATASSNRSAGSAASVATAQAVSSSTLGGSGTLVGLGASSGNSTASAGSSIRQSGVGTAVGGSTAAAFASLRTAAGTSSGTAVASGVGASVAAKPSFVIHGNTAEFFADGYLWSIQFGYDPAGGVNSFNSTRVIATNNDGTTWKTFNDYAFPRVHGYSIVDGASDLRIITSSYFGGAVNGEITYINKDSLATYNGRLSWNIFNLMANGTAGAAIGSEAAVSNAVLDGSTYYAIGGDAIDLVNLRMRVWSVSSSYLYFATGYDVVSTDPADPNKLASGPEFGLTITNPGGPLGAWQTLYKYSGRWFWLVGDVPTLYYNDATPPTSGWRRMPLDIGDGGRVLGLRQVGSYLVAWGSRPNSTAHNVAWSSDNGSTWTTGRPAGMSAGMVFGTDAGVAGGRLVIPLFDLNSPTTKYVHTTDPSAGFTLRTDLGASISSIVQAGGSFYVTYSTGVGPFVAAKTTDGLTFTPLPYPTT